MNRKHIHTDPVRYEKMTQRASPPSRMGQGVFRAFWVGGAVCTLGQLAADIAVQGMKMSPSDSYCFAAITLVLLTAVLTGAGVFDRIGQYAGAGAFVPITGFANAMVSPALEFRREGMVLGLGAKLFTIAGPVLVYGIGASVLVGLVYAILFH